MSDNKKRTPDAKPLRERAETRSKQSQSGYYRQSAHADDLKLLHELEVHKTELELQNEELTQTSSELRSSVEKYTDLYDHSPTGYMTLNKGCEIKKLNIASAGMLGKEPLLLADSDFRFYIPENSRTEFNSFIQNVFETKVKQAGTFTLKTEYSPLIYVYIEGITTNRTDECQLTITNITERNLAEKENQKLQNNIQQERDKLSSLVNSMTDEVWFADMSKQFSIINPIALKEFGIDISQEVNIAEFAASLEVYRPDGTPRPIDEAPPLRALNGEIVKNQEEIIRIPTSGQLRHREVSSTPVRDADGDIIGSISVVRDITDRKQIEKALQESENRFRLVLKNAPVTVAAQDRDLRFIWAYNQRTIRPSDVMGKTDTDIFPAEDAKKLIALKHKVMDTGSDLQSQLWITSNGKKVFLDLFLEPIRDVDGNITGVGIATVDLTQMKIAEDALREHEATLMGILNAVTESIWLFSTDGVALLANQTALTRFGRPMEAIIGKSLFEFLPEELANSRYERIREVAKSGQPVVFEDLRAGINFEHNFYPVLSENGRVERIAIFSRDITERKRTEEALIKAHDELEWLVFERTKELQATNELLHKEIEIRKQHEDSLRITEEKYRTLADFTYDLETWTAQDGKFIYISPSCERITGYSVHEFLNDPELLVKIVHPEDREIMQKHFSDSMAGSIPDCSLDVRIITRKGDERWIGHRCQAVYNAEGKWIGQRGSNRDITDRKKTEKVLLDSQKQLRALTKSNDAITEEVRTYIAREIHDELGHMLTALKYDIEGLAGNSELSAELVKNELDSMNSLVDALIDSVRKIASELRPGILDHLGLFPAIEWLINDFQKRTKIECHYSSGNPCVTFDKNETNIIFRILQEILTNVARHSRADKVDVSIFKKDEFFKLEVKDNGIGFVLEENLHKGALGLLGMQERALSIGGEIQIESDTRKGTTITFSLRKN